MADGPTVIETGGGGGTAVAVVVLAIAVIVAALFFTGVISVGGSNSPKVDVDVNLPKAEAPSAPAPTAEQPAVKPAEQPASP